MSWMVVWRSRGGSTVTTYMPVDLGRPHVDATQRLMEQSDVEEVLVCIEVPDNITWDTGRVAGFPYPVWRLPAPSAAGTVLDSLPTKRCLGSATQVVRVEGDGSCIECGAGPNEQCKAGSIIHGQFVPNEVTDQRIRRYGAGYQEVDGRPVHTGEEKE